MSTRFYFNCYGTTYKLRVIFFRYSIYVQVICFLHAVHVINMEHYRQSRQHMQRKHNEMTGTSVRDERHNGMCIYVTPTF